MGRTVLGVYAALVLIGGVWGYVASRSVPSLIAGVIASLVLGAALMVSQSKPKVGIGIGAVVAALLTAQFASGYFKRGVFVPTGLLAVVSAVAALLLVAALARAGSRRADV